MSPLIIHQSNQVEQLADALAEELDAFSRDPLEPATIVVQSRGMERWLNIELARRLGVAANLAFPFPNTILEELFTAQLGPPGEDGRFAPDALAFRIMAALESCLEQDEFAPLRDYLGPEPDPLRRYQLSQKIAAMYDQLATYRPLRVREWGRSGGDSWQAQLWRRLFDDAERDAHRPERFERFLHLLRRGDGLPDSLPQQLFIFGISMLPRLHLEAFAALAEHTPVHLFLLNPCRAFWHDIVSDKVQVKLVRGMSGPAAADPEALHFERGHPLLAGQGTYGQEFFNLLMDFGPDFRDRFRPAEQPSLLGRLQDQILELADPAAVDPQPVAADDRSLSIHSCHGPLREVEVLRDQLLRHLDDDPTLQPRDILVMAPEIETYAPYIAAVFDGEPDAAQRLPYAIADRARRQETPLAEAFLKLLDLKGARLTASEVVELLEEPAVRERFELALADLDLVRRWIEETRICWGIDGDFKAGFDLPPLANNTWVAGFDRLLLGFALPTGERALYRGILPYDDIEGSAAATFGRCHAFCSELFSAVADLDRPRPLAEWRTDLEELVDRFFRPDPPEAGFRLQRHLQGLAELATASGYGGPVDFAVVRQLLGQLLAAPSRSGFLRGGITFCSLLPMRSVPFKVVALLGMNDADFPRRSRPVSFDPMVDDQQPCDPSRRKEDRYLFLEALLSARNALLISYLGQNVRDQSEAPPSVVVAELLDALDQAFTAEGGGRLREQLVTRHRLQGFHPSYYTPGGPLFSYDRDNYRAALAYSGAKAPPRRLVETPLPTAEQPTHIGLDDLTRFFQNPARTFLRNRLGIFVDRSRSALQDQEPFQLDALTNYQLSGDLVAQCLAGEPVESQRAIYAARGVLPPGDLAEPAFARCAAAARRFAERLERLTGDREPMVLECDLRFGDLQLTGRIENLYPDGLLCHRCASIQAKDRLAAWVLHLAQGALREAAGEAPLPTRLVGTDKQVRRLAPVADSRTLLAELLELFLAGQDRPLPFFPKSSCSFVEARRKGQFPGAALRQARGDWLGTDYANAPPGEGVDPDFDFCFGRVDPLDADFIALAERILEPLLDHESREKA